MTTNYLLITTYYLNLGTNLGDKKANLKRAILMLKKQIKVTKISKIYHSKPMGPQDQSDFLNLTLEIKTKLEPLELLKFIKNIEIEMGRSGNLKWGPRIIDIDIMMIKNQKNNLSFNEILFVPHKLILEREFFVIPLEEIAPNQLTKFFNTSFNEILQHTKYKIDLDKTEEYYK